MLKIGLTGNIGSGKSTVSEIFKTLGIPVYVADDESRKFLDEPGIILDLKKHFGDFIIGPSGRIDRKALAGIVFNDPPSLKFLNGLIHPRVLEDFRAWCQSKADFPYIIQEAAILIESGFYKNFDKIIHVSCPEETAVERVIKRDGVTRDSVLARMRQQMPDAEKSGYADFIVINDGSRMILPQVIAIHDKLLAL